MGQRRAAPGRADERPDLRRRRRSSRSSPRRHARARRPHPHRHAVGRRRVRGPAAVPGSRRRRPDRDRAARRDRTRCTSDARAPCMDRRRRSCSSLVGAPLPPRPRSRRTRRSPTGCRYLGSLAEPQVDLGALPGRPHVRLDAARAVDLRRQGPARRRARSGSSPLPHFENEDIDVGNGIALISNDPSEGVGLLHVIDVARPGRAEAAVTSFNTGLGRRRASSTDPFAEPFGIGTGTGHTASCVQDCRFVYLAGHAARHRHRRPARPGEPEVRDARRTSRSPEATGGLATHDVQFDAAGARGSSGAGRRRRRTT